MSLGNGATAMNKKAAILIGDNEKMKYHPLSGPDRELSDILDKFEVEITEDYERFREESLKAFDLCISFTDCWDDKVSDEQAVGLLSYVAHGGGFMSIHNGISLSGRYELAQLHGSKFTGHPEQKVLTYTPAFPGHVITDGIKSFSVLEEPYMFEMDNFADTSILLEYESEGRKWPAAWAHVYGMGRVVYLSPGHNLETFLDPVYRKLIGRSAEWAVGYK